MEFTIVIGLDAKHLDQVRYTWPTIVKHKPTTAAARKVVFYDARNLARSGCEAIEWEITRVLNPYKIIPWDTTGIDYGDGQDKWTNPQRHRMLAGFLYVTASHVQTPYWLKIDTDAIATGMDDWIDPAWFADTPGIVGPPWSYTKPADQMLQLDRWAADRLNGQPLNLLPVVGASRLRHPRVAGWCNFFHTGLTTDMAGACAQSVGYGRLPVPSLDGFLWYAATRLGYGVRRVQMKTRGWDVRNSMASVQAAAEAAMKG